MPNILITGGTGLIGKKIIKHLLQKKYTVTVLTRNKEGINEQDGVTYKLWDVKKKTIDIPAVTSADAIIHLAGAGVMDKKWTAEYKKEILESRTKSSELLIQTLKENPHKTKVIVSASAIGWYGADKTRGHFFKEEEAADTEFLGEVCRQWEESLKPAEEIGIRVCKLRTGIVLSGEGGAYTEFKKPVKFGIAAILGSGKQMISWIHIDDLCRAYIYAVENAGMTGSYNAVAPIPVSNKALTLKIADIVRGKHFLPLHVPKLFLEILKGGRSIEILKSATVSAAKIQEEGFTFLYPEINAAVCEIEKKETTDQPL